MGSRTVKIGTEDTNKVISLVHSQKKKKKKSYVSSNGSSSFSNT